MRLALYQPDIPQNTGTILRMAACLGVSVDIIGPTGFDMTDRALRRSAMDYLGHVNLIRHVCFDDFERTTANARLVLLSARAATPHFSYRFEETDILLLGRETAGVPVEVHERADARLRVPMQPGLRSLNIAMAAALVVGEALRQTHAFPANIPSNHT